MNLMSNKLSHLQWISGYILSSRCSRTDCITTSWWFWGDGVDELTIRPFGTLEWGATWLCKVGGGGVPCPFWLWLPFIPALKTGPRGPIAFVLPSGMLKRAFTAIRCSFRWISVCTCSSKARLSCFNWFRQDRSWAISKCCACSIRNWEPCSHCRSKSCSSVCGGFPGVDVELALPPVVVPLSGAAIIVEQEHCLIVI